MKRQWWLVQTLYGLIFVTVASTWAMAGQVTLQWNANEEPDLAGYIIYTGTGPGVYTQQVDVGLTASPQAPEATIEDLAAGYTYYFAVTAYDGSFNESSFSNEVVKTVTDATERCVGSGSSRVWGRIRSDTNPAGIPGVTLTLMGLSGCTEVRTTKAWGLFWITRLRDDIYTIVPAKASCTFAPSEEVVILAENTVRLSFSGSCP